MAVENNLATLSLVDDSGHDFICRAVDIKRVYEHAVGSTILFDDGTTQVVKTTPADLQTAIAALWTAWST